MDHKISVIINTFNEERNISQAIKSVKWADEIIVCDMNSEDRTAEIAQRLGARVIYHKRTYYVEPARNYAISAAKYPWILILDADEEIPVTLKNELQEMIKKEVVSAFVQIPRKNIIFGKWMRASMWWPDYNIRFFRKGSVSWHDEIHSKPKTVGVGISLPAEEKWAIVHHNYQNISQFVQRMDRYSTIQANELKNQRVRFDWRDILMKPMDEFLSRYFANRGYLDGIHGLALSLLQSSSFLLVYLKLWELNKFKEADITISEFKSVDREIRGRVSYWIHYSQLSKNYLKKTIQKIKYKAGI